MLTCLLGDVEGQLTLVGPRTRVVLAGHDVRLNFSATVLHNSSAGCLQCYRDNNRLTPAYILQSDPYHDQKKKKEVVLHLNSSSESGEYYCSYKNARVNFVIVARDVGFKRTYTNDVVIAPVATLTVLLLIFSTVGSCYIYKSQAANERRRDSGTSATQSRTSQKEDDGGQEGTSEEATANSVYTALESRPTSIYDVLDPSALSSSRRTQSKKKTSKRLKKKDEVASEEDGIFESVYENL